MSNSRARHLIPVAVLVFGVALSAFCTLRFPAVKGLGTKVRLPVFHGAMTWVNLAMFTLLAVAALAFLFTRRQTFYRYAESLRWISVAMWLAGTALGTYAAFTTWDFTGSGLDTAGIFNELMLDPRLKAQFWILFGALVLVALEFVLGDRRWTAALDIVFVIALWVILLTAILGPGRAFHPDSPVMNSEEMIIKLYFFGIVAGNALAALSGAWLLAKARAGRGENG